MISNEELDKLYDKTLAGCKTYNEEIKRLKEMKSEHRDLVRRMYCNNLLYVISQGYTKYNCANFEKDELIQAYLDMVALLPKEYEYYHLTYYFFKRENKKCLSMLEKYMESLYQDSGYDDAYKQTAEYLDWFEQSDKFSGKKIYGIICLNNPTKQLVDKVHADKRMKIFEYQISYTEL